MCDAGARNWLTDDSNDMHAYLQNDFLRDSAFIMEGLYSLFIYADPSVSLIRFPSFLPHCQ